MPDNTDPTNRPILDDDDSTGVQRRTADYQPPRSWRTWLIGRPLQTADSEHESIGKLVGLAVFASDALSSTAYATQEILIILAGAGAAAFIYAYPIAIAIVILLAIVTVSYEQIIHAYPGGGGAYIVARDNLGELPAQIAGAALLTDYILTVAVSISAGVAQITSAFPALYPYRVEIAVALGALHDGGESARRPRVRHGVRHPQLLLPRDDVADSRHRVDPILRWERWASSSDPPHMDVETFQAISLFLILHAFASGTTALTGVEAISNGITAFREPRSRNAGITLIWMSSILAVLFLGITFLAVPDRGSAVEHETVISQLARTVFDGRNAMYLASSARPWSS